MNKKTQIPPVPCQIQQLSLSCYGCCGRDWKNKTQIINDLEKNTKEFESIKQKTTLNLLRFRDRLSDDPNELTPSGLCSNLVKFKNKCIACPLHPKINKLVSKKEYRYPNEKLDLRINHCDVNYECETFIFWKLLTDKQKLEFVNWVKKEKLQHFEYSQGNIDGTLIRKFLDEKNISIIDN